MAKKLKISVHGASTTGECPYCYEKFTVSPMVNDADSQLKKLDGIYAAHLKVKHSGEDVNEAGTRIIR